jgi:response regulator RpfG family c-di-GMP phosphodiesterase
MIETDLNFQKIFSLNLNAFVGAETFFVSEKEEALDFLRNDEEGIDVVITNHKKDSEAAIEVLSFLNGEKIKTDIVNLAGPEHDSPLIHNLSDEDWKEVIRKVANILEVTSKKMMEQNDSLDEMFPILLDNLYNVEVEESATDVYVFEDDTFEVIIEAGEEFPLILLKSMKIEGVKYLYIKKNERLNFINQITNNILLKLGSENLTTDEKISIGQFGFDTFKDILSMAGMTEQAIELAEKSVENMSNILEEFDEIEELLKNLRANSNSYRYQHSVLNAAISYDIVSKIEWGSKEQKDKICFISLFHDILLETDEQAKIASNRELKKSEITPKEKKLVEQHALKASLLIKSHPKAPYGADSIIMQHHGMLNGVGFPKELNSALSPLAIVFMIAEDYTDQLLNVDAEFFKKDNVIATLKERYNKGMFKKVVETLEG